MPQSQPAIAGLGVTEQGKVYGKTAPQFAAEAVRLAAADAGLTLGDLDGLIVSGGVTNTVGIVELDEGPWWWTSITGADPDEDLFGRRVQAGFEMVGDGETIPYFTVIEETTDERR